ncbi:hypothetical protein [Algoriphagus zhangzhouensis]|uniref:Uncharacterized protein n=1 Tax=Algoriphagus zhangzhouensis TaxID=1073327 RepID=A0A1M7ZDJ4_9BACT|nr:hypothetical protein [Algoriphagus zhangzhouensis]TDY45816.1 hypothetical protein A8938_2420 [Algoriphagus zhangzhouensis]SHO62943.1 hypothetical protein SAMN04488108_2417 [Algoriphagus zhangzhouensis]
MKKLWVIFFLISGLLKAQEALTEDPIATIPFQQLDLISFDTKDQIFASNTKGDIYLYDSKGSQKNYFSPPRQGKLNQLEANWTVNIFSFSYDLQSYQILDRFLNPISDGSLMIPDINLAKAATLGNNNVVWIWDESDFSLKRMDFLRKIILDSQPLNLILDIGILDVKEIREFKNMLFMNVPQTGVFIFDNQGNLIKKLEQQGIERLCFWKEYLLWIENETIWSVSIENGEKSPLMESPIPEATGIQIGQENIAIYGQDKIYLYQLPEKIKTLN